MNDNGTTIYLSAFLWVADNVFDGNIGQVDYTAAKGAIESVTRTTAREFSGYRVRVNAIAPGPVNTPMLADVNALPVLEPTVCGPALSARKSTLVSPLREYMKPDAPAYFVVNRAGRLQGLLAELGARVRGWQGPKHTIVGAKF